MSPRVAFSSSSIAGLLGITLGLALGLSGCADNSPSGATGSTSGTSAPLAAGGAANVYAMQGEGDRTDGVLVYGASSTGTSVAPTLSLPLGVLVPQGDAFDSSGYFYLAAYNYSTGGNIVNVYQPNLAAGATVVRSFTPSADPIDIAVTGAGQVYVLEEIIPGAFQIEAFAPGATTGSIATATIAGTATVMTNPQDIAVDTAGNIYVANYLGGTSSQVLVYAAGANGNAAPARTISFGGAVTGVAVDSSLNVYVGAFSGANSSIAEYAAGASGAATPLRTIAGTATGLNNTETGNVRLDSAGNIWIIQQGTTYTYFEGFGASASGNVAPAVLFSSPALTEPNATFTVR